MPQAAADPLAGKMVMQVIYDPVSRNVSMNGNAEFDFPTTLMILELARASVLTRFIRQQSEKRIHAV